MTKFQVTSLPLLSKHGCSLSFPPSLPTFSLLLPSILPFLLFFFFLKQGPMQPALNWLLILLPPPSPCQGCRHVPTCPVYMVYLFILTSYFGKQALRLKGISSFISCFLTLSRQVKQTKSKGEGLLSLSCPLKNFLSFHPVLDTWSPASFNSIIFQNTGMAP